MTDTPPPGITPTQWEQLDPEHQNEIRHITQARTRHTPHTETVAAIDQAADPETVAAFDQITTECALCGTAGTVDTDGLCHTCAEALAATHTVQNPEPWEQWDDWTRTPTDEPPGSTIETIEWADFWTKDHTATNWFAEPLLAEARTHVLYAPAKTGKSLLALEVAAAVATGRPILDTPPQPPRRVLYLDYEMVPSDLYERLTVFGYTCADNLDHLHYCQLPAIPHLDTFMGGQTVQQYAHTHGIQLVVIDTTVRAVAGDENAAETVRDLYHHTLKGLKAAGVTTIRVDHAGKNLERGQRGSSAKNDDADIVWLLTNNDDAGHYTLKATHRRVGWVPETVHLKRHNNGTTPMHQRIYDETGELEFDPHVRAAADGLEQAGCPPELGRTTARRWLDDHGHTDITWTNDRWPDIRRLRQQRALAVAAATGVDPEDLW